MLNVQSDSSWNYCGCYSCFCRNRCLTVSWIGNIDAANKGNYATFPGNVTPQVPSNSVILPVNIQNPAVKSAQVRCVFTVTIRDIQNTPLGLTLNTDIKATNIPVLVVTKDTGVQFVSSNQTIATDSSILKPGQKVELIMLYRLKAKAWGELSTAKILSFQATPTP